jgi:hypothetical protein
MALKFINQQRDQAGNITTGWYMCDRDAMRNRLPSGYSTSYLPIAYLSIEAINPRRSPPIMLDYLRSSVVRLNRIG